MKTAKKRKMLNDLFDLNRKIMIGELGYLPSVVEAISKIIEENGGYDLEQPEAKSIIKELKCENMDGKTPEDEITKNKTAKMIDKAVKNMSKDGERLTDNGSAFRYSIPINKPKPFQIGDIVRLKSGGPKMSVMDFQPNNKKAAGCMYSNNHKDIKSEWFDIRTLEKVEE